VLVHALTKRELIEGRSPTISDRPSGTSGHESVNYRYATEEPQPTPKYRYDVPRTLYNAALRQLSNRLVGILHGCLKTGTHYSEATAWNQHAEQAAA
jgi:poly(3-hydroxybutyrate) depolymerase